MKKLKLKALELGANEVLTRAQLKNVLGGSGGITTTTGTGGPGGNNGNPCPEYCEPMGGKIYCEGTYQGVNYIYSGNCNTIPHSGTMGLHNVCINAATGNFWC